MNVAVSHKELQAATKDLNEALGIEPKLKVIAVPAAKMGDAIIDAIAPLVENEAEIAKLAPATIVTYNKLVAVMGAPPQEDDSNPAVAQADEGDCFGISYDSNNPACAEEACSQAVACAEKVTGKKKKKASTGASKKPKEGPTKKSICVSLVSRPGGASLDDMAKAQTDAGLGEVERNKKTSALWLKKLGFPVKKLENGNFVKA